MNGKCDACGEKQTIGCSDGFCIVHGIIDPCTGLTKATKIKWGSVPYGAAAILDIIKPRRRCFRDGTVTQADIIKAVPGEPHLKTIDEINIAFDWLEGHKLRSFTYRINGGSRYSQGTRQFRVSESDNISYDFSHATGLASTYRRNFFRLSYRGYDIGKMREETIECFDKIKESKSFDEWSDKIQKLRKTVARTKTQSEKAVMSEEAIRRSLCATLKQMRLGKKGFSSSFIYTMHYSTQYISPYDGELMTLRPNHIYCTASTDSEWLATIPHDDLRLVAKGLLAELLQYTKILYGRTVEWLRIWDEIIEQIEGLIL